jgi:hypothetical protein
MIIIPNKTSEEILKNVHNKLNPNMVNLFLKVFIIHAVTAIFTLALCPQFGVTTYRLPFNLMNSFMVFGMSACDFLCGLFLMMSSGILAITILKHDELRALRFNKILLTLILILGTIGSFSIMNPNIFLELSILWLLGASIGVVSVFEFGPLIKQKFY